MLFLNQSDAPVYLAIGPGGIYVEPKKTVEIPDGYAHPRRADNGSRRPSVVEELAGSENGVHKLVPADPAERAEWLKAPSFRKRDSNEIKLQERVAQLERMIEGLGKDEIKHAPKDKR